MSLKAMIQSVDPSIIVKEFGKISDLFDDVDRDDLRAIFLDLGLPDGQGLMNVSLIRSIAKGSPVVVVTADEKPETRDGALQLGAAGFWPKSGNLAEMETILRDVFNQHEAGSLRQKAGFSPAGPVPTETPHLLASSPALLSPAQIKVLNELVKGHSNKIIAYELGVAEATVKSHLAATFRALGATNRSQALLRARELGLIG